MLADFIFQFWISLRWVSMLWYQLYTSPSDVSYTPLCPISAVHLSVRYHVDTSLYNWDYSALLEFLITVHGFSSLSLINAVTVEGPAQRVTVILFLWLASMTSFCAVIVRMPCERCCILCERCYSLIRRYCWALAFKAIVCLHDKIKNWYHDRVIRSVATKGSSTLSTARSYPGGSLPPGQRKNILEQHNLRNNVIASCCK